MWTVLVALASLASVVPTAEADLTVSFATDGVAPAMSVTVVQNRDPDTTQPELTPTPEPAPVPVPVSTPAPAPALPPAPPAAPAHVEARFVRVGDGSGESDTLTLRDPSDTILADALERLSVLARPRGEDVPGAIDHDDPDFVAPGIRRLHAGLLPLLARLSEHFPGRAIEIVSGYRPNAREGSRHRFGRALDLRVEGIAPDEVRAYLDGEPQTGVGLYPISGFVHLDVRTQSVRWVDDSGPGQPQHVVRSEVVERPALASSVGAPAPEPALDAPAEVDADAIERAMHAADAITLDFALPP